MPGCCALLSAAEAAAGKRRGPSSGGRYAWKSWSRGVDSSLLGAMCQVAAASAYSLLQSPCRLPTPQLQVEHAVFNLGQGHADQTAADEWVPVLYAAVRRAKKGGALSIDCLVKGKALVVCLAFFHASGVLLGQVTAIEVGDLNVVIIRESAS